MKILDFVKDFEKKNNIKVAYRGKEVLKSSHVSTGVFALDMALLGGIPENNMTLIYGKQSSGKSMVSYKTVANFQKKYPNKFAVWVDLENTHDPEWASVHGVDAEKLIVLKPQYGEQASDLVRSALESDDVCLVVFDSIPGLISLKEQEKATEDVVISPEAMIIRRMVRTSIAAMIKSQSKGNYKTLILINQWREKAGFVMGDPRTLPGGKAPRYFNSVEIEMFNKETVGKDSDDISLIDYNTHEFKIHKNKLGNSVRQGEFKMIRSPSHELPQGTIDDFDAVFGYAQKFDLASGAGISWGLIDPTTGEILKFKSKKEGVQYLRDNREVYEALKKQMIQLQRVKSGKDPNFEIMPVAVEEPDDSND